MQKGDVVLVRAVVTTPPIEPGGTLIVQVKTGLPIQPAAVCVHKNAVVGKLLDWDAALVAHHFADASKKVEQPDPPAGWRDRPGLL